MSAAALAVSDLCAGYGATRIVEGVGFALAPGARLAVLGRNGAGKTTLLAALAGQVRRYGGSILLDGEEIGGLPGAARARRGLGYVPQTRDVFASLTVEENLRAGLKDRPRAALEEAYALFPRLAARRSLPGPRLSGGEQQMLSLARTLLGRPRLLLLDEPLEGLAPGVRGEVMGAIEGLARDRAATIVLVEQALAPALAFAEEVLVLDRGRIAWRGTPAGLRAGPEAARRLGLPGLPPG